MSATLTEPIVKPGGRLPSNRVAGLQSRGAQPSRNVSDQERLLSVASGAVLSLSGLSCGSLGGLALAAIGGSLLYRGLAGHCSVYQAFGVNRARPRGRAASVPASHGVKVEQSLSINRSPEDLYRFWRDFENLGRLMKHLESVRVIDAKHSHWVARGPLGYRVEWDAEIINERPNELIAWRSLEGSEVRTAGSVHFRPAPAGRGTEIHVSLKYDPPAGKAGAFVAKLFGEAPEWTVREDLRRFKQLMETGEIATIQGQPQGTCK
jgi:uncharacterized membrane protein